MTLHIFIVILFSSVICDINHFVNWFREIFDKYCFNFATRCRCAGSL